jgi:ABC-type multidrug transport system fused ATPase/permease subunit
MSEEILKALMQLFALIVKQDDGVGTNEISYVHNFLTQQLNDEAANEYLSLFNKQAGLNKKKKEKAEEENEEPKKPKLTSVRDSVKILGICKKINKTLTQNQKVVVLVRLFELINSDGKFTEQRMAIINTVSEVFKISKEEYANIEKFVTNNSIEQLDLSAILTINDKGYEREAAKEILTGHLHGDIFILQIKSVDLYFLRYTGNEDINLNGLPVHNRRINLFAPGSTIKLPKGKPIYYSDVVAHYLADSDVTKISYNVDNLGYTFKTGGIGLRNISFSEGQGKLVGIMGASGAGKTTLLNVLSGINTPTKDTTANTIIKRNFLILILLLYNS